jgi:hypothetical protein
MAMAQTAGGQVRNLKRQAEPKHPAFPYKATVAALAFARTSTPIR